MGEAAATHPRTLSQQVNVDNDAVHRCVLTVIGNNIPNLNATALYAAGELTKIIATDEDGRESITFVNAIGQTVLSRKLNRSVTPIAKLDTYTVYDDLGRTVCLVSPAATEQLAAAGWQTQTASFWERWLYYYTYDERGRLSTRQFPGSAAVHIVYDQFDRPVLMQDGNARVAGTWLFTKWDQQGRPVVEGIYYDSRSRAALQEEADRWSGSNWEARVSTPGGEYSLDQSFPLLWVGSNVELLSVIFYDDYDLNGDGTHDYSYRPDELEAAGWPAIEPDYAVLGRATVTRRREVLAGGTLGDWLTTVHFFDQYGNLLQQQSNSILSADRDALSNTVTLAYREGGFVPQVMLSLRHQETDDFGTLTVRNRFA